METKLMNKIFDEPLAISAVKIEKPIVKKFADRRAYADFELPFLKTGELRRGALC